MKELFNITPHTLLHDMQPIATIAIQSKYFFFIFLPAIGFIPDLSNPGFESSIHSVS